MKKVSRKIFGLLAAAMIFAGAGAFVSCSNGSDSSSALALTSTGSNGSTSSTGPTAPLSDSATVSEVAAVSTSGSAELNNNTATLTASNGVYILTAGQGINSNISANGLPTPIGGGTWIFKETGKTTPKYAGTYEGSIATIGISPTSLTLKVEIFFKNGLLTAVVEVQSFSISFTSTSTEFNATIPAVEVSSVTTYVASKENVRYDSEKSYNIGSTFERIDLADGKITSFMIGSKKTLNDGKKDNKDDNSHQLSSGTYTIANGKLTVKLHGETKTYMINANGDLTDTHGEIQYNLTNASGKLYANAITVLDGDNSYAHNRIIGLNEDSGKTGQLIEIKRFKNRSKDFYQYDITYEISGNTVTLTGAGDNVGYSKTATISDDGKTLTLGDDVYLKM